MQSTELNAIPMKLPMASFTELEQNNSQFVWKHKRLRIVKTILKNRVQRRVLPSFKIYYKATATNTVCNWPENRKIYQRNRIEGQEREQHK